MQYPSQNQNNIEKIYIDQPQAQSAFNLETISAGTKLFLEGKQYVSVSSSYLERLRLYFDVDNQYVLRKILLLLFPFRHKKWTRVTEEADPLFQEQIDIESKPTTDLNAPDLYIPLVSLITFVLSKGYTAGTRGLFHPDILGFIGTYSVLALFCLAGLVKIICYFFGFGPEVSLLDIFAVLGYNFLNLCLVTFSELLFGSFGKNIARLYICISMSFFVIRSMLHSILPIESQKIVAESRQKKINLLIGVILIQLLFSFLLTQ